MKIRVILNLCFLFINLNLFSQVVEIQKSIAWNDFEAEYGDAVFQWKEGMSYPHRVICTPIKLANAIENKEQLEVLLRIFIQKNKAVFQIENAQIRLIGIQKARKIWYANFLQTFEGKEVLNSEIIFRVHENGNLFVFGLDYFQNIELNHSKLNSRIDLSLKLKDIYSQKTSNDISVFTEHDVKILPLGKDGEFVFKTVFVSTIKNETDLNEVVFTDAHTFEILEKINKIHHQDIQGNVKAQILPILATDVPELRNLANIYLDFDGIQVVTDEFGNFNYPFSGSSATLTAQLKGTYVDVSNFSGPDAIITQNVQQNDVVNLVWDNSNSSMSERNVFYHINEIHKKNKQIDPNFTFLDYPLPCVVNDNAATCNAYFNGTSIHFNVEGSECSMNSAHGASVIYHEYGHAINDRIYNQVGIASGMGNQALQEAFADIYSCLLLDESRFALGWFGTNTFTRNLNNNNSYPNSIVGQQHTDGLILGGAFWDLRLLTSSELAYELAHFAKYGTPDDSDLGMAFSEVYIETLVADDDDGNLMNGTPNSAAIEDAFCQHGIGSDLFAVQQVNHTSLPNTLDTNDDYHVEISLDSSPFIPNSLGDMSLIYTTDNFANTHVVAFAEVNTNSYEAFIPSQEIGTLIKYYFEIPNGNCGNLLRHPSRDFLNENYSFYIGAYVSVFEDDFETNQGWQLGDASDDATFGLWQRSNPQIVIDNESFIVQPEDDHSLSGVNCLVTGAARGAQWYSGDVDAGKTTVTSPVFDFLNETSIITFYKWFVHGAGFLYPAQGQWVMEITNNGTDWIPVETASYGDHRRWIKSSFKISELVPITEQIQVRFIASDFGAGSIVEALVDDFNIVNLESSVRVSNNEFLAAIKVYPNPVNDEIYVELDTPLTSKVSLKIYSVTGQLIENISTYPSGPNTTIIWQRNASIPTGIYFLKITSGRSTITKKMIFK